MLPWPAALCARLAADRDGRDPRLAALVGELSLQSHGFRVLWVRHEVHGKSAGAELLHHPRAGDLEPAYETHTTEQRPRPAAGGVPGRAGRPVRRAPVTPSGAGRVGRAGHVGAAGRSGQRNRPVTVPQPCQRSTSIRAVTRPRSRTG
ncbi:hypothetical protein [Kitasatospora sp. NPDC093679]|uniref:MmyB family transcriptional regulator n=1 Tax=Kitasatospora sp. NPDC093679 TaxID=3154983 RepID=UPI0034433006